jgi:DNA mismatch repair protein MutL
VRDLFFNVPARRNFLKSPSTEFKHLVEVFQRMALANPHVAFALQQDDHEVYSLSGSDAPFLSALTSRVAELLGPEHRDHLIGFEETSSYLSARGVLGDPSLFRKSRGEQFLFVNGRAIKDRSLDYAIRAAYEALLPEGSFPAYVVFLDIDPKHVDVNVHPAKSEVKFDDERGVFGFVRMAVQKAISDHLTTPKHELFAPSESAPDTSPGQQYENGGEDTDASASPTRALRTPLGGMGGAPSMGLRTSPGTSASARPTSSAPEERAMPSRLSIDGEEAARLLYGAELPEADARGDASQEMLLPGERGEQKEEPKAADAAGRWTEGPTWTLGQRYVVAALRGGLIVVDARLAHQRVLYERALADSGGDSGATQQLLFPITLELGAVDHVLVEESDEALRALGFDVEPFSGRAYVLRGVPPNVRSGEERSLFMKLIASLRDTGGVPVPERIKQFARLIAQHGAVADATGLSHEERRRLVADLLSCEMPYAAPNGATTFFQLSPQEAAKRLGQNAQAAR